MKRRKRTKGTGKEKPVRLERRVRVTFFLVAQIKEEIAAARDVYLYLDWQYWSEEDEQEIPITGHTHSVIPPPAPFPSEESAFIGSWWYTTKEGDKIYEQKNVVLFIVDLTALAEEWKTDQYIRRLKERILSYYAARGSPQQEIWVTKQDIYRYA